jgi:hypothetical protein
MLDRCNVTMSVVLMFSRTDQWLSLGCCCFWLAMAVLYAYLDGLDCLFGLYSLFLDFMFGGFAGFTGQYVRNPWRFFYALNWFSLDWQTE